MITGLRMQVSFNWFITLHECIKKNYHFSIYASIVYKTFYYQGENKPCHMFQKSPLTKAI